VSSEALCGHQERGQTVPIGFDGGGGEADKRANDNGASHHRLAPLSLTYSRLHAVLGAVLPREHRCNSLIDCHHYGLEI